MKKKLMIAGGFVVLVGLLLIAIPFFIDVNKYRTSIEQMGEQYVNGKIDIGSIELSLWKGPSLALSSVSIRPKLSNGTLGSPAFQVDDIQLRIPWHRILFSPVVHVEIKKPIITVEEIEKGKLNTSLLMGSAADGNVGSGGSANQGSQGSPGVPDTGSGAGSDTQPESANEIPEVIQNAAVNLDLTQGTIHYKTKLESMSLQDFDLSMKNLSLKKDMELNAGLTVDIKSKEPKFTAKGRLALLLGLSPKVFEGKFHHLTVTGHVDLTGLGFSFPPALSKNAGSTLKLDLEAKATSEEIELKHLGMKTGKSKVSILGKITDLKAVEPQFDLKLDVNPLLLEEATHWVSGAGSATGKVIVELKLKGKPSQVQVNGSADINANKIQPEGVAQVIEKLELNSSLAFSGRKRGEEMVPVTMDFRVPKFQMNFEDHQLKADLALSGDSENLVLKLNASSDKFDLDRFSGEVPKAGASGEAAPAPKSKGWGGDKGTATPNNELIVPLPDRLALLNSQLGELRKIKQLAQSNGTIDIRIKELRASGINMNSFRLNAGLNRLKFTLNDFSFGVFGGTVRSSGELNLRNPIPEFGFKLNFAKVDTASAAQVMAPSMAGLVSGSVFVNGNYSGRGILWQDLKTAMTGKGSFELRDGVLSTIPIGKWIAEAVEKIKFVDQYSGKIRERTAQDYGDKIRQFEAQHRIEKGVIYLAPVTFEYATGDLGFGGEGTSDFDQNLNFIGSAKASSQLLPVAELKGADGRTWIPLKFGGTLNAPKVDYGYTVEQAGKKVASGKAKAEAKKQLKKVIEQPKVQELLQKPEVQEAIQKPEVQEGLKNLLKGKKLF